MLGHEPAPIAILDCVEPGLMQPIDAAIRSEMSVFAHLIQRKEARNMIRTMFLGKQAYEKSARAGSLAPEVENAAAAVLDLSRAALERCDGLRAAGFGAVEAGASPVQRRVGPGYWLRSQPLLHEAVTALGARVAGVIGSLQDDALLQLDHACLRNGAVPAYLGGATGLADYAHQGAD